MRVHAEQREEAAPGPASMIIIDILAMISSLFLFTPADIEPPSIKPKGKCDQTPFFFNIRRIIFLDILNFLPHFNATAIPLPERQNVANGSFIYLFIYIYLSPLLLLLTSASRNLFFTIIVMTYIKHASNKQTNK